MTETHSQEPGTPRNPEGPAAPAAPGGVGGMTKLQYAHALVTHPLIAAVATGLLALVAVVGLSLPWARTVVSAGQAGSEDADMILTMSGFGMVKSTFEAVGLQESWIEATFLSIAVVLLFLVLASAVLVAFTPLRRIAAVIVAGSGAGLTAYSIYGLVTGLGLDDKLFTDDTSGLSEQESAIIKSLLDSLTASTGPGEYVVLVAGVLLLALGGYVAVRSGFPWLPSSGDGAGSVAGGSVNAAGDVHP
ncbi:hypothetical protein BJF89_11930 [Corynebacterium sp. CNJ-954]|uniref:hypothetical protein n=1 Tax=Corynebacterium sp. CNJ-954 TaxID=1904962 RepID=UPI00095944EE|nr:hypothetical protein [Corynebacterium sp. CNJ-954]OLT56134.1 hypothetical protein BJF89_11930 [Corynebacterium sp. CNJ-954]